MHRMICRTLKIAAVLALASFSMFAGGCYTIEGVGEDVSAAGQTLADWAHKDTTEE